MKITGFLPFVVALSGQKDSGRCGVFAKISTNGIV